MSDFDTIVIVFGMLFFGVSILLSHLVINSANAGNIICGALDNASPNADCQNMFVLGVAGINVFSTLFLLVFVGSLLASAFFAAQVQSSPMFFVITLFMTFVVMFAAPIASNIYFAFYNNPNFASLQDSHTMEVWFFSNAPILYLFSQLFVGFFIHGKPQARGTPEGWG